jgi:hypothetical protein
MKLRTTIFPRVADIRKVAPFWSMSEKSTAATGWEITVPNKPPGAAGAVCAEATPDPADNRKIKVAVRIDLLMVFSSDRIVAHGSRRWKVGIRFLGDIRPAGSPWIFSLWEDGVP